MKKIEVITVSEEFTTYKILGTEFEILQDNKDKEIFLETSDRTFCTYQPMTWSCRNYTEDYAFKRLNGTYVHLYNRKSNDYLTIVLNEDNSINIISHITDCLPDSEIQHISDSHFTLKGEKAQPWETGMKKSDYIVENKNTTQWILGDSGFKLLQYHDDKYIYLKDCKESPVCCFQTPSLSCDNDLYENKGFNYIMTYDVDFNLVKVHNREKNDYMEIVLDNDKNIQKIYQVTGAFDTTNIFYLSKNRYRILGEDFKKWGE